MVKPLIAGNWKMHTIQSEAVNLAREVAEVSRRYQDRDVMIAPPFTSLTSVAAAVSHTNLIIAGQNVSWEEKGAHTGEISPVMLKDAGCTMAIVGHSERRHIYGEDDRMINKRNHGALRFGLIPVLCIGETLEQRESRQTFAVLEKQLHAGLEGIVLDSPARIVVAYEPVWAIGTGKTATDEQTQEAHAFVRNVLGDIFEKTIASQIRILYGGSVKPDNIDNLMKQSDVNGVLVGGASLNVDSFARIIQFK